MIITPVCTRVFVGGESLERFIIECAPCLREGTVLAVASKIVALSQRRTAAADERTKERLIRAESTWAVRTKYVWLTLTDGMLMANAGIDESNGNGKLILLPKNSDGVAVRLRRRLMKHYHLRRLGVVITDSRTAPLRAGVTGVAVSYAGFRGVRDYRGAHDLFGRRFHFSRTNVADCLATSAVLTMGEGDEQQPLAVIENAPVEFSCKVVRSEVRIPATDDMYRPVLTVPNGR